MDPRNRLLHHVLECSGILRTIADRLDSISDATELPFNPAEHQQLQRSVANVEQLLLTGEKVLALEVDRWGL